MLTWASACTCYFPYSLRAPQLLLSSIGKSSEVAVRGFRPDRMQAFKASDACVEAVLRHLAVRGATILQAKKGTHPSLPEHDPNTDKG